MKVIDAHIHFQRNAPHFDRLAQESGYENSEKYLQEAFKKENIVRAVVMSNIRTDPDKLALPDFLSYCTGIGQEELGAEKIAQSIEKVEQNLQVTKCVGLKFYAGYTRYDLNDPILIPFFELAQKYNKPVAVHMGTTAHSRALLKYAHPLLMDEIAVSFPQVQFVMCHFGNPWLMDAAAVLEKNENVAADLSGLIAGKLDVESYLLDLHGYVEQLRTWIHYVENYSKFMFGTDWPLTDFGNYIRLFEHIIPEKHLEDFYFNNAMRIYNLPENSPV